MDPIVEVFCFCLSLCLRQFGAPLLMRSVCHVCRDDGAFHIIMKPHAICCGLRNGRRKLFEVRRGNFVPVKGRLHDGHHYLLDGCCRRPLGSSLNGAEELIQIVLIDCPKIRSVCRAEDQIGDLGPDNCCDCGRYVLLYLYCREPCCILPVRLILCVDIRCDIGSDDVVVRARCFSLRSIAS